MPWSEVACTTFYRVEQPRHLKRWFRTCWARIISVRSGSTVVRQNKIGDRLASWISKVCPSAKPSKGGAEGHFLCYNVVLKPRKRTDGMKLQEIETSEDMLRGLAAGAGATGWTGFVSLYRPAMLDYVQYCVRLHGTFGVDEELIVEE